MNHAREDFTLGDSRWLFDACIMRNMVQGTVDVSRPQLPKIQKQGAGRNVGYNDGRGGSGEDQCHFGTE